MNWSFPAYPEGEEQLLAGLAHNTALHVFSVWDCKLNVKSVCALIEQNTTLQELDLSGNPHLCEDGNELMVLSSLKKNTTLQKLHLPYKYDHPVDARVEWIKSSYEVYSYSIIKIIIFLSNDKTEMMK